MLVRARVCLVLFPSPTSPPTLAQVIWLIANLAVFLVNWFKYQGDSYAYLRDIVGVCMMCAHSSARFAHKKVFGRLACNGQGVARTS
jgi:hypothetical protein